MSDYLTSPTDKSADATNFATKQPTNPTPNARSHYDKKPNNMEKEFVERFRVGDRVQVSGGRGVGPTIYTIESISEDGKVTVRDGLKLLPTFESKLRKVD